MLQIPKSLPCQAIILLAGEKLDPRAAIAGRPSGSSGETGVSGLFDNNTWQEANAGWARTVVTGRARLGGTAVGVSQICRIHKPVNFIDP